MNECEVEFNCEDSWHDARHRPLGVFTTNHKECSHSASMTSSLPQDIKFITSALRTSGTGSGNLRRRTFPGAVLTATSLDTRLNLVA